MGSWPWVPLLSRWVLTLGLVTFTHVVQFKLLQLLWGILSSSERRSNGGSEGLHPHCHTAHEWQSPDLNSEPVLVSGARPAIPCCSCLQTLDPSPTMSLDLRGFLLSATGL